MVEDVLLGSGATLAAVFTGVGFWLGRCYSARRHAARSVDDDMELRIAQQRIAEANTRFRDGIRSMADGFVMWDREDRLITHNERLLELLPFIRPFLTQRVERRTVIAAAISHAQPSWTDEQCAAWVNERLASLRQYDKVVMIRSGDGRSIEAVDRPTSEGGSVTIYRDVTERERQTAALERALLSEREMNAQQRRFIAIASHEFRTPLAIIDGATQRILARLDAGNPELVKRLARIRAAVSRMTQLIDRTLSSARLDDGRIDVRPERFDLAVLIDEVCARQSMITPEFEFTRMLPPTSKIEADPNLIEQVLSNLISNAVKYSGAARRIEVALTEAGGAVAISVRDHGLGIAADEVSRLFTRFFRATTANGIAGTGIGLHLVRELVTMHRGTVTVESTLGRGSVFVVTLPRMAGRRVPLPAAAG